MSSPVIVLYQFFRNHPILFYLFFGSLLLLIFWLASGVRVQENISGITGDKGKNNGVEEVFSNIKLTDKLIVHLSLADPGATADPEKVTRFAKDFTDSLAARFDSTYIKGSAGSTTDTGMNAAFELMFEHLPLFLDETDYRHIDTLLKPEAIRSAIAKDYKNLLTPAGFALRKTILRDPLGFSYLAMNKLKSLQAGGQFDLVNGFVMTRDRKDLLLFITPANPPTETSRNQELIGGIDDLLESINGNYQKEIKAQYFGAIAFSTGNASQIKKDIYLTLALALTLIFFLLAWYFRSWKIPLLGFLPAVFGGGFALAVLFIMKGTVSAIALGIGSVILGLIVDYALYIVNLFQKKGAMTEVLKEMTLTILLCCITTAGAFLCLVFLRSSVLHDLGWFSALSVAGAAFFTLVILPHFITSTDRKKDRTNSIIDRFASLSFEKVPFLAVALLVILIISLFFANRVKFQEDMMALNFIPDRLKDMEKELDRITDASARTVYVVSTGKDLNEALRSGERNDPIIRDLIRSGVVRSFSGCGQILLSDSLQQVRLNRWKAFWTKPRREMLERGIRNAAGEFRFKENAFDAFLGMTTKEFKMMDPENTARIGSVFLSDYISTGDGRTLVTGIAKVRQENKEQLYKALEGKPGLVVFDKQILTNRFVANVKHDFELLVRFSMIFVTALLLLFYGRIETGIAAALPMYASWYLTLFFMAVTGIQFNIFNIIVSSFIFGLGVDYSILMMRGLLSVNNPMKPVLTTYKTSILLSSLTTLLGVAVLFFARHPALNSIAAVSVVGIVAVVGITFTLQPVLVNWFLTHRLERNQHPITARIFFKSLITWANIVLVAFLQLFVGGLIFLLTPVPKRKKQYLFHWVFAWLCKAYIFFSFPTNRKFFNPDHEDFSKPAVIISNHQSLIETPLFLRLHPKILILTNDWVWNSPLFGPVARMASFFNADKGIDSILGQLKEKVSEGYSILIFPEAHRYNDYRVHRFHRGAFYIAEKLEIDLLPVVVFGSGDFLGKGWFWGRPSGVRMQVLPRFGPDSPDMGSGYSERSKRFRKFMDQEYKTLMAREGTGHFYRKKLLLNNVFRGPVLEWYLRVKMKIEKCYQPYNELLPREGEILDLGCGYGFISYMLSYTSPSRRITGVDYDEDKILVAKNGYSKTDHLEFHCADITTYDFDSKDAILISDVLHYLDPEQQERLLTRCLDKLRPGGILLVRDADPDLRNRHRRTKLTELFSTRIIGFNKTAGDKKMLCFTSVATIREWVGNKGLRMEVIREAKHTSNVLMIIRNP